ncbi:uncharacterized protein MELLADRAFT_61521 [Melampsora larici-populina 98AG31]|uniref:Endonuclease/exonuclease/phosphatase domain-containing protein n=1 Tax=Melampsora larici-populina (strain 98AG31 / pathotype 3-4-7) TaxID=747676 RepID=F4RF89_MELLP|nr:uncharacterized protein MELLADRAFT_61521 [Melampsora larici-populina 98AG31]EGG08976.1 hypothetical protein MELLADRAFT_61521 [Melampsora larici-populina 98AG31]
MGQLMPILGELRPNPVLLGMDSDLHHPMWNSLGYAHTHRESEDLISIMNTAGLLLRSKAGVPTFTSNNAQGSQTTVDLQWTSPECYDWATTCVTDTQFKHSHFSDHMAILTELDLPANPLENFKPKPETQLGQNPLGKIPRYTEYITLQPHH